MNEQVTKAGQADAETLAELNRALEPLSAEKRVAWSLQNLPGAHVLTSSFGAQAAVSLHLVTRQAPRVPVILLDTGYLFPETYAFVETLTERLSLNLKVYRSTLSPAWIEARFGKFRSRAWPVSEVQRPDQARADAPGVARDRCAQLVLGPAALSGAHPAPHPSARVARRELPHLPDRGMDRPGRGAYLKKHDLPYHPMWDRGYVSIGDWHTTRPLHEAGDPEATRFLGLKRECGLHGLS